MFDFIKSKIHDVKTKKQEIENGKILAESAMSPFEFVNTIIIPEIQKHGMPARMINRDKFRHQDNIYAISDLVKEIADMYIDRQCGFKKYVEETPYNKMLLWGIMFSVLYTVLVKRVIDDDIYCPDDYCPEVRRQKVFEINALEYKHLPKRYRGAFVKDSSNPDVYVSKQKNPNIKYRVRYDEHSPWTEVVYCNTDVIKSLIDLIYKEEVISSWSEEEGRIDHGDGTSSWWWKTYNRYGQMSDKSIYTFLVSNEQFAAINSLKDWFVKIASMCVVNKQKHGQQEILSEIIDEKKRKNVVLNSADCLKSSNKLVDYVQRSDTCNSQVRYDTRKCCENIKSDLLWNVRRTINTRIK